MSEQDPYVPSPREREASKARIIRYKSYLQAFVSNELTELHPEEVVDGLRNDIEDCQTFEQLDTLAVELGAELFEG